MAKKIMLLGSGELGKEFVIAAQRLGQTVVACDSYAGAPAMQVADACEVFSMLDGDALAAAVARHRPDVIVPEIEAIRTERLYDFEREGIQVVPSARAVNFTMNRKAIRDLAARELGLKTAHYFYATSLAELEEAAELDGASKWQIFWNVTLPQLKPTTFFVIIMLTIASFKVYDQMYMITQGGPGNATMTLVYYIYNVAFVNTPKYGYASAVSMVLFVLVLFVTIIQFKGSSSND